MPRAELYKYTPGQASGEELDATFVARTGILEQLLGRAREWAGGEGPEHTLILGPRGMGKTHLLRLFALRMSREPECVSIRTAVFPEESYTVGSADELLLAAWGRLGSVNGAQPGAPISPTADWVLDQMRRLHATVGARFLFLVDGFDLLLDQMRESDEARLHQVLTTEPHICLIGTTTRAPEAVTAHDRPLFHAFRLEPLRPLDAGQSEQLLQARAQWAGDEDMLERWPRLAPRVRAVSDLAGGNPRLLLMLYQSLEPAELPTVIQAFRALLDELTPFFKHVVESRAPQQRKLLSLAALHDRGVSPSELAVESGLAERHVSALLGPLVKDGLLKRVRRPGARVSAYPFTEPLLRMWLQARASPEGERQVRCIVEFFRSWYEGAESEYVGAFSAQLERAAVLWRGAQTEGRDDVVISLRHLADAAPTTHGALLACSRSLERWIEAPAGAAAENDLAQLVLDAADRAVELEPGDPWAHSFRAMGLQCLRRGPEAVQEMNRAISRSPNPAFLRQRSSLLSVLGRPDEAIDDLTRALMSDPDDVETLRERAKLCFRLDRWSEAIGDFDRVLSIDPLDGETIVDRAEAFWRAGRRQDAIQELNRAVAALRSQPEAYVKAKGRRGLFLFLEGQSEHAIDDLSDSLKSDPGNVALLCLRGAALVDSGRSLEGLRDIDRILLAPPDDSVTRAFALNVRGTALLDLGRPEEALESFEQALLQRAESYSARVDRGLALLTLGRATEAMLDMEQGMASVPSPSSDASGLIPRLASSIAQVVVRRDYGLARNLLTLLVQAIRTIWDDTRPALAEDALRRLFRTGDVEFCRDAVEVVAPLCGSTATVEPFRQALEYVHLGRDPYFLEALNPDLRRAVELIADEFGTQGSGPTALPDDA